MSNRPIRTGVTVKSHKPKRTLLKWKFWIFGNLIAFIILVLAITDRVQAGSLLDAEIPVRVTVGGWSHHLISDDVTNETHDHFGVQVGPIAAGRFNNSYGRESYYIGYVAEWDQFHPDVTLFLKSGLVRGYLKCEVFEFLNVGTVRSSKDNTTNTCPLVVPGARYTGLRNHGVPLDAELSAVGDAINLDASTKFDLMSIGRGWK